ncbi:hypothetical protein G6M50_05975 [Agrobacterium rhizogenes]|nr:hypothetical protein [Rhizobium rhizogenes]NTJ77350.1 hypothetical protein [Rhizobium rhizogenes]
MSYSTANDDPNYRLDLIHLANMRRYDPGVTCVQLFIATSMVGDGPALHDPHEGGLIVKRNTSLKSNVGRDFSSCALNLRLIAEEASPDDYILFTNRSGYGPTMDGWYSKYIEQYHRHPNVQLCGTSINFLGHPDLPHPNTTHVQTYAFMGKMRDFAEFVEQFPGERETERLQVIQEGEIGLSRRIMERGGAITSLAWPEVAFTKSMPNSPAHPFKDIKGDLSGLPFLYRMKEYENIYGHPDI